MVRHPQSGGVRAGEVRGQRHAGDARGPGSRRRERLWGRTGHQMLRADGLAVAVLTATGGLLRAASGSRALGSLSLLPR